MLKRIDEKLRKIKGKVEHCLIYIGIEGNIKGYDSLTANQKHYLMNLYRWCFQKAKETNRARFRVLSDQILVDLAITEASTIEMLELTGILTPEKISLYGREIIKAVLENKQSQQAL